MLFNSAYTQETKQCPFNHYKLSNVTETLFLWLTVTAFQQTTPQFHRDGRKASSVNQSATIYYFGLLSRPNFGEILNGSDETLILIFVLHNRSNKEEYFKVSFEGCLAKCFPHATEVRWHMELDVGQVFFKKSLSLLLYLSLFYC